MLARLLSASEKRQSGWDALEISVKERKDDNAGVIVTPESALRLSAVFAAVRILAETIGSLPLILYEKQDNKRIRAVDHPLYPVLHDAPNEIMTSQEFKEAMQGYLALRGNAIAQKVFDGRGNVVELWPLRWENVYQTKVDRANNMVWYLYMNPEGQTQWLNSDIIWHLRGWGSDGIFGYSPIQMARRAVGLSIAAEEFGARFFANDARPGIVLEHPGSLGEKAEKNLRESWEETHQGVSKSHRVAILEEGMKLHEIGINQKDSQFLETRKFQVEEIARIFRIPPHMLADLERATFNNIEQQSIEFITYSILSWARRWEFSSKKFLLTKEERKRFYSEFLFEELLRGDTKSRYDAYTTAINSGWFTRADAREKENMEPIEGLEKPLVPLNMMPLGETPPAPGQPPQKNGAGDRISTTDYTDNTDGIGYEARAMNAAQRRHRLMKSYHRLFEDAAKRILRREVNDVRAAGQKYLAKRDLGQFNTWLDQFYKEHKEWIWRQLKPLYDAYGDLVTEAAIDEVKAAKIDMSSIEAFIRSYLASFAGRHAGTSEGKIRQALEGAIQEDKDQLEALNKELDGWVDGRSSTIADEEASRANNAIAITVYSMAGVLKIRSVAFGENCPYCTALNGKVIGIQEFFITAGKDFQPEGAERPLTSADNLRHAPYHGGCDCMTVAA